MKEIVIKIPDETLNVLMEHDWNDKKIVTEKALKTLEDAFFDGEILPKGHGELIDARAFLQSINTNDYDTYQDYSNTFDWIADAETLVEADKGEEE